VGDRIKSMSEPYFWIPWTYRPAANGNC
jgi:hypothetical protein